MPPWGLTPRPHRIVGDPGERFGHDQIGRVIDLRNDQFAHGTYHLFPCSPASVRVSEMRQRPLTALPRCCPALRRRFLHHPTRQLGRATVKVGSGPGLCENAGGCCSHATIESKSQSRRIFDACTACCLNQSCAQMARRMVFAQPRAMAGIAIDGSDRMPWVGFVSRLLIGEWPLSGAKLSMPIARPRTARDPNNPADGVQLDQPLPSVLKRSGRPRHSQGSRYSDLLLNQSTELQNELFLPCSRRSLAS